MARLRGTSSESVATYLERLGGFSSEPFEVTRFVLFSSRASVGGGPYVVEAAYPLEDLGAALRRTQFFAGERGASQSRAAASIRSSARSKPLGAAEEGIGHVLVPT